MRTLSAFSRQLSARAAVWKLIAVLAIALLLTGAGDSNARFSALGHRMMCTCGCNQILLECNHVGCTVSETMRTELSASLERGDNDDLALQGFVQKYGPTVLAAPTTTGFNRVAWIMPFLVLGLATWFVVMFVRRWQGRPQPVEAGAAAMLPAAELDALRRRAREETQL